VKGGYTEGCASREIDPANTILDGGGIDTVLALVSQGAANFSVEGLTLRNGNTSTVDTGGGLYANTEGHVTLTDNIFAENTATSGYCGYGGGVYVPVSAISGSRTLTDNTFTGNAAGVGGGAYVGHNSILKNNTFTENTATSGRAGGADVGCNSTLTGNTFTGNTAYYFGGGADVGYNSTLTNNLFTENTSGGSGGGIYSNAYSHTTLTLINNTISRNTAENQGGGIWISLTHKNDKGEIYNDIICNNSAPVGADIYIENSENDPLLPFPIDLFNNDFDQSTAGTYIKIPFVIDLSNLNNADPLFVGNGDYHLTESSPCINSGDNDAPDLPSNDKDGNPRIFEGTVDMGAYEFSPIVYIAPDGLCESHTPCYSKIQDGIDWDGSVFTIKAEQGTYGEDIVLDEFKEIVFKGGWNSTFTSPSGETKTNSMTISKGTVVFDEGCLAIGE